MNECMNTANNTLKTANNRERNKEEMVLWSFCTYYSVPLIFTFLLYIFYLNLQLIANMSSPPKSNSPLPLNPIIIYQISLHLPHLWNAWYQYINAILLHIMVPYFPSPFIPAPMFTFIIIFVLVYLEWIGNMHSSMFDIT